MKQYYKTIPSNQMLDHITWRNRVGQDALRQASNAVNDTKREKRLAAHECQYCYYLAGRVGGAAMTQSNCRSCNVEHWNSSTCTDEFCEACAKKFGICRHCGADLDLKTRKVLERKG